MSAETFRALCRDMALRFANDRATPLVSIRAAADHICACIGTQVRAYEAQAVSTCTARWEFHANQRAS